MSSRRSRRREFLRLVGCAGAVALAGCDGAPADDDPADAADDGTPTEAPGDSPAPDPSVDVPEDALEDEPVDVVLRGMPPGETVTLRATASYPDDRPLVGQWESHARFQVPDDGRVALADAAPAAGTYDAADAMGPFWSMRARPDLDDPGPLEPDGPTVDEDGRTVTLYATVGDEVLDRVSTRRRYAAPGVSSREAGDGLVGRLFLPPGGGPHPGAVLLHGGGGGSTSRPARLLASRGVAAMALQYFGPPEALPDGPAGVALSYFRAAIDWLLDQPEVADGGVGLTGLSLGGSAALLLASRFDDVDAAVAISAPTVVFSSEVSGGESPWSVDGEPVPHVPATYEDAERRDGRLYTVPVFETALREASDDRVEAATIPVEEADATLLYVTGGRDAVLDAGSLAERSIARLDAAGAGATSEHLHYPEAGHQITFPYTVTAHRTAAPERLLGGTPAGLARAAADSWPRIRDVLASVA